MPGTPTTWDENVPNADVYAPLRERGFAKNEVLLLFDARHACYRSIHTRELSTSKGEPTSALHGMIETIQAACTAANTGKFLCVWDGSLKYKRALYPGYKERQDRDRTREEMARYREEQRAIQLAHQGLDMLGVPQVYVKELEADDVIGLIAKAVTGTSSPSLPKHVVIISDDKDYYQLIDSKISVWRGCRGELVDLKNFRSRFEFEPIQYIDYKALVGEAKTGDNIPGVDGVGDVTACKLVATLGGIERIIMHAKHEIVAGRGKKTEQRIYQQVKQARISYKLSRIMTKFAHLLDHNLPLEATKQECIRGIKIALQVPRPLKMRQVIDFMGKYEFNTSMDSRKFASTCGYQLLSK